MPPPLVPKQPSHPPPPWILQKPPPWTPQWRSSWRQCLRTTRANALGLVTKHAAPRPPSQLPPEKRPRAMTEASDAFTEMPRGIAESESVITELTMAVTSEAFTEIPPVEESETVTAAELPMAVRDDDPTETLPIAADYEMVTIAELPTTVTNEATMETLTVSSPEATVTTPVVSASSLVSVKFPLALKSKRLGKFAGKIRLKMNRGKRAARPDFLTLGTVARTELPNLPGCSYRYSPVPSEEAFFWTLQRANDLQRAIERIVNEEVVSVSSSCNSDSS